jgi:hypothetical protein
MTRTRILPFAQQPSAHPGRVSALKPHVPPISLQYCRDLMTELWKSDPECAADVCCNMELFLPAKARPAKMGMRSRVSPPIGERRVLMDRRHDRMPPSWRTVKRRMREIRQLQLWLANYPAAKHEDVVIRGYRR